MPPQPPDMEILLPTCNGGRFLCEQLDSLFAQTDTGWHLTVSDDGSTDGTVGILQSYLERYPGRMALYRSGKKFGSARDHFFALMRVCTAGHVLFSDQDDVWFPDKVKKTRAALADAEKQWGADTPILVFTDQTVADSALRPIAPSLMRYQQQYFGHFDYRSILLQNVVTGCAAGVNRALIDKALACADTGQTIMHDWWLAAVAARFGRIVYLDESTMLYRQHGGNSVGAKDVGSARHVLRKLADLQQIRATLVRKKRQADAFLTAYGQSLNADDRAFLQGFCRERSGPVFYWRNREWIHGFFRLAGMMLLG